jgi:hypothetical protein
LNGEDGNDVIEALDNFADTIRCGIGMDTVNGYNLHIDTISEDCEIKQGGID